MVQSVNLSFMHSVIVGQYQGLQTVPCNIYIYIYIYI